MLKNTHAHTHTGLSPKNILQDELQRIDHSSQPLRVTASLLRKVPARFSCLLEFLAVVHTCRSLA